METLRMAVTRRIRNLTLHFLGGDAERLAGMFDGAYSNSRTLRRDMDETSRSHSNIYIGRALGDLEDQPNYGEAEFDPESQVVRESPAFGKAAGAETHFIIVKPGSHSLFHDGRRFDGSSQLALIHELLHPSQMIRELADQGALGKDTEHQTQMREQRIAAELGMTAGKDFPDVIGSGATYESRVHPQPNPVPAPDSLPVAPMGYFGPASVQPTRPSWREADGSFGFIRDVATTKKSAGDLVPDSRPDSEENTADRRPTRYLSSRTAGKSVSSGFPADTMAPPLVPSDEALDPRRAAIGDRLSGWMASAPMAELRSSAPPDTPARLLGLVSGEPMSFYPAPPPIFGTPEPAAPNDEDWLMQLLAREAASSARTVPRG